MLNYLVLRRHSSFYYNIYMCSFYKSVQVPKITNKQCGYLHNVCFSHDVLQLNQGKCFLSQYL